MAAISSIQRISAPAVTFSLYDIKGRIQHNGTSNNIAWYLSFEVLSSSRAMGPQAGRIDYSYLIPAGQSTTFLPPLLMLRDDRNFYLRIWADGRIAVGTFGIGVDGIPCFIFGLQQETVTTITNVSYEANRNFTYWKPHITFESWWVAHGPRMQNDLKSFARGVFNVLSNDSSLFPSR